VKGIVLAGGSGTRLMPLTDAFSKQLLPIYDKPMIFYPLSILMLAGIKEVLIITTKSDQDLFKKLLGNGENYGIQISYKVQDSPNGIADAFIIGQDFIGESPVTLILGDNIFFSHDFSAIINDALNQSKGAHVFLTNVSNPEDFGVAEVDKDGKVLSIQEKPEKPDSNLAVTGLYIYDNEVVDIAKALTPSSRGELEITDVNLHYLKQGNLNATTLGRGFTWLDTGTHESLISAGEFVKTIEERQGLKIGCLEEIAFNKKWIEADTLKACIAKYQNSPYGAYLQNLLKKQ
tara:strand:+ start:4918 stop:5787 length:870 start_codon:yes stop_codon:yes gene_type:complete